MLEIAKIHIWESDGFWVIDFYETSKIDGSEALKVCTKTRPEIVFQPRYTKKIVLTKETCVYEDECNHGGEENK